MKHEHMTAWKPEEDQVILALFANHGRKWGRIASSLPGRTSASVRNRYLRIERGQQLRQAGLSKNRCASCGQQKIGHVCPVKRSSVYSEPIHGQPQPQQLSFQYGQSQPHQPSLQALSSYVTPVQQLQPQLVPPQTPQPQPQAMPQRLNATEQGAGCSLTSSSSVSRPAYVKEPAYDHALALLHGETTKQRSINIPPPESSWLFGPPEPAPASSEPSFYKLELPPLAPKTQVLQDSMRAQVLQTASRAQAMHTAVSTQSESQAPKVMRTAFRFPLKKRSSVPGLCRISSFG
eukprot:CAMPEP_0183341966 /NCGR_PEP_ID=MMETSP0164_2-20130417/8158_1 /TAXON_ID=221442 /ORGANISM="Coccolithus pelagicus ssp braarudi, Strain PLY182g" /LENGTH=290 /DNA_ID=CAMNT_0025512431 /DNA_START=81 /DNA_END=953 /DNA_ORIENTATION=-